MKRTLALFLCAVLILATLACGSISPTPRPPAATLRPLPTSSLLPTATAEPGDTGWKPLGNGIELRRLKAEAGGVADRLWIVRVDPARVRFRVLYDPSNPRPLSDWFASAPVLLAVNGGYFTEDYSATGLLVSDGEKHGQSYKGFGGMFAVRSDLVQVRSLSAQPYNPAEPLRHAVQAFPMLLHPGGKPSSIEEDGLIARRTVVGQDRSGRIVFILSHEMIFTLKTLVGFLASSDLGLDTALNLDGGPSSGMLMASPQGMAGADSWTKVPAVIVAEPK